MDMRARRSRETSPDRAKIYIQPKLKPLKKVQIIYYLCRNGQLEHPHFMEVSHPSNQPLRLKDVLDRLTALRGKGMPILFSWSCKRSYKNGYVWNDLADNDVIYPAEGAEIVLKGSELIEGCAEKFLQYQMKSQQNPEPNFQPKLKPPFGVKHREQLLELEFMRQEEQEHEHEHEHEHDEGYEDKRSNSIFNIPYSQRSRGVSADKIEELENPKTVLKNSNHQPIVIAHEDGSPPSTSSTTSEKTCNNDSQRLDIYDTTIDEPVVSRNSVFFQLIACGSSTAMKEKNTNILARKRVNSLHRDVLYKTSLRNIDNDEINYMSENPRFGNLQSEEKEYFSGSIVEAITEDRVATEPSLKKSSSYNEERSTKVGLEEVVEKVEEKAVKGKCIPRMICSSKQLCK